MLQPDDQYIGDYEPYYEPAEPRERWVDERAFEEWKFREADRKAAERKKNDE